MKICYVLLDGSNATSDIFYFMVEDNGRNPSVFYTLYLLPVYTLSVNWGPLLSKQLPKDITQTLSVF